MDTSKVYALCLSKAMKSVLTFNAGHRFREHHSRSYLRQSFHQLSSTQEHRFDCIRRYRRWPTCFRFSQRLLVPQALPHNLHHHHDCLLRPLCRSIWRRRFPRRHARSTDRIPISCRYWNRRRIPSGKCRRLRRNCRTQARAPKPLVCVRHKLHDRHGFRDRDAGSYDCRLDHLRKALESSMAHLPWYCCYSTDHLARVPLPAQGTRGVQ